jgi:molybdate transport system ATP-binding protein
VLISIKDITVQSGRMPFFEHITWTINEDECWGVLGANGSGKSLLVKAICRQVGLAHGQIHYFFDPQNPTHSQTFPNPGQILVLSAETHQAFFRRYGGYHQARWQSFEGEDAPTVAALLNPQRLVTSATNSGRPPQPGDPDFLSRYTWVTQLFDLGHLLDRKIVHLSHGESRKVFLSHLLLQAPCLLVLDNPYIGLDRESRERLAAGIGVLLKKKDPHILFITSRHDELPDEIDHLLIVRNHRISAQGGRQSVMNMPDVQAQFAPGPVNPQDIQPSSAFDRVMEQFAGSIASPAGPPPIVIHIQNVQVSYGKVDILKNINWTVRQGERWALLGPNGAGKTTLLSLILADNPQAYANDITLFGKRRGSGESIWDIKKNIGWVSPEQHIFYPHTATCLEVVCSGFYDSAGLYQRSTTQQIETASEWMAAFGFEDSSEAPFHTLSAGLQRLLLLIRALVKFPSLLVLDEPCQGLDEPNRKAFVARIDKICEKSSLTLIYVTHIPSEIPASVTHYLSLENGQIV